ncbi:unnamed protein product [Amoebophrya sp. A25]|nr:unnamed protein product [Amoebophrya sp. A25]|eukprot:GSA25T00002120001.1
MRGSLRFEELCCAKRRIDCVLGIETTMHGSVRTGLVGEHSGLSLTCWLSLAETNDADGSRPLSLEAQLGYLESLAAQLTRCTEAEETALKQQYDGGPRHAVGRSYRRIQVVARGSTPLLSCQEHVVAPISAATLPVRNISDTSKKGTSSIHISITVNNHAAVQSSNLIKTYMSCDFAKSLVLRVKSWARDLRKYSRDVASTQRIDSTADDELEEGGLLSGYAWTLIVIAFLQSRNLLPNVLDDEHQRRAVVLGECWNYEEDGKLLKRVRSIVSLVRNRQAQPPPPVADCVALSADELAQFVNMLELDFFNELALHLRTSAAAPLLGLEVKYWSIANGGTARFFPSGGVPWRAFPFAVEDPFELEQEQMEQSLQQQPPELRRKMLQCQSLTCNQHLENMVLVKLKELQRERAFAKQKSTAQRAADSCMRSVMAENAKNHVISSSTSTCGTTTGTSRSSGVGGSTSKTKTMISKNKLSTTVEYERSRVDETCADRRSPSTAGTASTFSATASEMDDDKETLQNRNSTKKGNAHFVMNANACPYAPQTCEHVDAIPFKPAGPKLSSEVLTFDNSTLDAGSATGPLWCGNSMLEPYHDTISPQPCYDATGEWNHAEFIQPGMTFGEDQHVHFTVRTSESSYSATSHCHSGVAGLGPLANEGSVYAENAGGVYVASEAKRAFTDEATTCSSGSAVAAAYSPGEPVYINETGTYNIEPTAYNTHDATGYSNDAAAFTNNATDSFHDEIAVYGNGHEQALLGTQSCPYAIKEPDHEKFVWAKTGLEGVVEKYYKRDFHLRLRGTLLDQLISDDTDVLPDGWSFFVDDSTKDEYCCRINEKNTDDKDNDECEESLDENCCDSTSGAVSLEHVQKADVRELERSGESVAMYLRRNFSATVLLVSIGPVPEEKRAELAAWLRTRNNFPTHIAFEFLESASETLKKRLWRCLAVFHPKAVSAGGHLNYIFEAGSQKNLKLRFQSPSLSLDFVCNGKSIYEKGWRNFGDKS